MDKGRNIFIIDSANLHWCGIKNHMSRGHKAVIKQIDTSNDDNGYWPTFRITVEIIKAK